MTNADMTFEQSGLPDKGKLREAFALAAENYAIYTPGQYVFERKLKIVRHMAAASPELPADVLTGAMLSSVITQREGGPVDDNVPEWRDVVETYGETAAEYMGALNRVRYQDVVTCPPLRKEKGDYAAMAPESQQYLLADMTAAFELIAEGKYMDVRHVAEKIKENLEIYEELKGRYPALDRSFDAAFAKIECIANKKDCSSLMKNAFNEAVGLFWETTRKPNSDIFLIAYQADQALLRRDEAERGLSAVEIKTVEADVAAIKTELETRAAEFNYNGIKILPQPVVDPIWGRTYRTITPRLQPGHA